jgi:hypothetical protein
LKHTRKVVRAPHGPAGAKVRVRVCDL